jgi:hypothetical protein
MDVDGTSRIAAGRRRAARAKQLLAAAAAAAFAFLVLFLRVGSTAGDAAAQAQQQPATGADPGYDSSLGGGTIAPEAPAAGGFPQAQTGTS